jgi:hypothetical protein
MKGSTCAATAACSCEQQGRAHPPHARRFGRCSGPACCNCCITMCCGNGGRARLAAVPTRTAAAACPLPPAAARQPLYHSPVGTALPPIAPSCEPTQRTDRRGNCGGGDGALRFPRLLCPPPSPQRFQDLARRDSARYSTSGDEFAAPCIGGGCAVFCSVVVGGHRHWMQAWYGVRGSTVGLWRQHNPQHSGCVLAGRLKTVNMFVSLCLQFK